jgi:hypothetical protein
MLGLYLENWQKRFLWYSYIGINLVNDELMIVNIKQKWNWLTIGRRLKAVMDKNQNAKG